MSLSTAHSWNTGVPSGKSTDPHLLTTGDLHNLVLHSLAACTFPSQIPKASRATAHLQSGDSSVVSVPHTAHRSWMPQQLPAPRALGLQHTSTRLKHGRFKKLGKRKPTAYTSLGNGILFLAKPTLFANSQG